MKTQTSIAEKIYNAAVYVRLSKEDGDVSDAKKAESNSISNQKQLIKDFIKTKENINIVSERVDDGFTGSNFERPAFQQMLKDVENGRVNCIVVKDLSRFGREYIDAGKYLEQIFPALGVRFISINDHYDTLDCNYQSDQIIIPFKNLINDAYCRDISIKIRSHLEVKRKNGEYIGAFTPYGYKKNLSDSKKIDIDEYAAAVVEDIFKLKISGMSHDAIAEKLNGEGILCPLEYKKSLGLHFHSGFQLNGTAKWSSVAVKRILQNEVYIGNLVQGKRTTPNHKVKIVIQKQENQWNRIEDSHEAIISKGNFELVQKLLLMDTRTSPLEQKLFPLSGITICGDCGAFMTRKTSTVAGKKYVYYICSENKLHKTCSSHRIPSAELEAAVLATLQEHIRIVLDMNACMKFMDSAILRQIDAKKLKEGIGAKEMELHKYSTLIISLYEDLKSGLLSEEDYKDIKFQFTKQKNDAKNSIALYAKELEEIEQKGSGRKQWIEKFQKYQNIEVLDRTVAVEFIENIKVYENKQIEILFSHSQEFEAFISTGEKALQMKANSQFLAREVV